MNKTLVAVALLGATAFARAEAETFDAAAYLRRVDATMGASAVQTLRYSGAGSAWQFGQGYKPGAPWPKLYLASYARILDYAQGVSSEEIVRSRAEPTGGGAVPATGQQKLSQVLAGDFAWNMAGPAPAPAPTALPARVHDLWITPHGVLKAAQKNKAALAFRSESGRELAVVSFTEQGKYAASAFINGDGLVERVESRMPNPVLGDTLVVTHYEDYRTYPGFRFPGRIRQSAGGHPVFDLAVTDVKANDPVDVKVPDPVRAFAVRVTSEKVADGVWYLAGGSHHSVAIEMKDHLIVVESPLDDARGSAALAEAKKLVPGKPIRYLVNSHWHFDHAGGVRAAAAEGATIVSHEGTRAYFETALANPARISPDLLAKSGRKGKVMGAKDGMVLTDGTRKVEIRYIRDSVHAVPFLMVWLPQERLLIEADAFTPPPPNTAPASPPNPNNVNLAENIERLKLPVDRILPLHGRVVPLAELHRAIGR